MLTFAFMHHPYLVCILFGMPSLHLFTFLMFFYFLVITLTSMSCTVRIPAWYNYIDKHVVYSTYTCMVYIDSMSCTVRIPAWYTLTACHVQYAYLHGIHIDKHVVYSTYTCMVYIDSMSCTVRIPAWYTLTSMSCTVCVHGW